jgi:uncharacterized membrane protein
MVALIKTGRIFFAICMMTIGINQLFYADFRMAILPQWPALRTNTEIWAWLTGVALICAGIVIIFSKKGKEVALVLGSIFLALIVFCHLPYLLFINPHKITHLGLWADASKALALSGGAFAVAGSFSNEKANDGNKSRFIALLGKFIPFGRIFFSITMIEFGVDHFLYTEPISKLVPGWIPWPIFWTYFAGAVVIGSGIAIVFKIKLKSVALLQGIMIFLWFIFLHVPRAIMYPFVGNGNEVLSAGDALAFSGTAFIIAFGETTYQIANRPG